MTLESIQVLSHFLPILVAGRRSESVSPLARQRNAPVLERDNTCRSFERLG